MMIRADFFKAIAHPLRIAILDELRDGELHVSRIRDILGVEAASVSQQLAILRARNIVATRKEGIIVYYFIKDPLVTKILDLSKEVFSNQLNEIRSVLEDL